MCILLKLHYAKFDVSSLFSSKVIEEKPLVGRLDPPPPPPLGKGRVNGHQAFESMSLLGALIFFLKQHIHYRNNY